MADTTRPSATPQTPAATSSLYLFLRQSHRSGGQHEAISHSTNTSCYFILLSLSAAVAPEWRTPRGHQPLHKHQLLRHPFIHFCGSRAGVAGTTRPSATPQTPAVVTSSFYLFLRQSRRSGGHHEAISHSTNTSCYFILLSLSAAVAPEWRTPRGHQPLHKNQLTYDGFNHAQTVTKTGNVQMLGLKICIFFAL